jgi:hypothetical protein
METMPTPSLFRPPHKLLLCTLYRAEGPLPFGVPLETVIALMRAATHDKHGRLVLWTRPHVIKTADGHFFVSASCEKKDVGFVFPANALPVFQSLYNQPETGMGEPTAHPEKIIEAMQRRAAESEASVGDKPTDWWLNEPEKILAYVGADPTGEKNPRWVTVNTTTRLAIVINQDGHGVTPEEKPAHNKPFWN